MCPGLCEQEDRTRKTGQTIETGGRESIVETCAKITWYTVDMLRFYAIIVTYDDDYQ
jgi:hypothetical protein